MLYKPSARRPFWRGAVGARKEARDFGLEVGAALLLFSTQVSGVGHKDTCLPRWWQRGPSVKQSALGGGVAGGQWYPAGPRCLKQRPSPLGLLTGHGWRRSLCADKFLPLKAFWPQEGVLALSCQFPLPFPSSARALLGAPSFFVCVMLPGEGRWSPQFLGLFLPPPWLGQLPEGPAPRIRLPSRRAETAICLLRSAEFSLSTPSPAPQRRPTPGPRPCRTRRFPRTRALCLQPWEGPGPPETAPGLGGRSGCAGRRLSRASPSQAARASAASPRGPALPPAGGPRSGTRGTGVCSNSPRLRDARYAPRAVRPEPLSVAPEPATRARDPGEAGRDRTGHFRRLRAAIAPPLPASATRVGRAGSRRELRGAGRGRRGGAVSGPGWRVRLLGLSRGGSLRRDAPKPVQRALLAGGFGSLHTPGP